MKKIKSRKLHIKKDFIKSEVIKNNEINYSNKNTYQQKNNKHIIDNNTTISIPIVIILVLIVSLISGCLGAYFILLTNPSTTTTSGGVVKSNATLNEPNSISNAVDKVYDAVVVVEVYNENNQLTSTGTGFVYKKDTNKNNEKLAFIMTNNHVIAQGKIVKILFTDGTELEASLVGNDTFSDIAVLSVKDSDKIISAAMGDSSKSKVGDTVFTVGSPEGSDYAGTVTKGIISAKDRLVAVALENNQTYDYYMQLLQTDAAINPGNSGGPICNISGEVIGITSMKLVDDKVEGMGFAIPIEEALKVVEILEENGKITRPKLGVDVTVMTNKYQIYYQYGILIPNDIEEGIIIVKDPETNTPAANSGLKKGDIIIKIEGHKTKDLADFRYELYKHSPGEEIEITYIRDNKEYTTKLTLSE